jgi:glycosyltransferase involved in cell wall biosynthesis
MRVGVYADMAYRRTADGVSTRHAFIRFVTALPPRVDEVVLLGRLDSAEGRATYAIPRQGVRFVALPHYPRVTSLHAMLRSLPRACATFAAELPRLDAVLLFGPHPVAVAFAAVARRHGTPLVLGVRQDYPRYIRRRLPSPRWRWAVTAAAGLDRAFRELGRGAPRVVAGDDLARRYGGRAPVLSTGFPLFSARDLVAPRAAGSADWDATVRVLSVGRLEREKNPLLLVEILTALRARSPRWRLTVVGDGPLRPALERAAAERGLADALELRGEVPNGGALWDLYRSSHVLLHVSLTEGLPQVLLEAHAAGLPVVATDVGGVAAALGEGTRGLLVAPGSAADAVAALERLAGDGALRRRLAVAGLAHARHHTLESELDRLAALLSAAAIRAAAPASATSSHRYRSNASVRKSPAVR